MTHKGLWRDGVAIIAVVAWIADLAGDMRYMVRAKSKIIVIDREI